MGKYKHGLARTPEFRIWLGMRNRCYYPRHNRYHLYGGRGIVVCDRWSDFANFYFDMGPRPTPDHSIERIDTDGNYEPRNCRWATPKEQANNQTANVRVTFNGITRTLAEWSKVLSIPYHTLKSRIRRLGWSAERAFTEPVQVGRRRVADLS